MKKTFLFLTLILFSCSTESDTNTTECIDYIDLAYGSDSNQKIDLYLPAGRNSGTPLLIIVHGGGWAGGDKSEGGNWPKGISQNNMAVANVNYRLVDGVSITWHDQIEDINSTEKAEHKPEKFMAKIQKLLKSKNAKLMDRIYADLKDMKLCYFDETRWGTFFHKDIETTWMRHEPYIADL